MATKKDLVEAYSFSRRRLVTAFVSGAPGGREVEPSRPGRAIIGGLALAVLLIAGAAIAGVFTSNVDEGWADAPALIVSKEQGAAYVITASKAETGGRPVLHPILNITSAKLILGADRAVPTTIPDAEIAEEDIGEDLGILGAPNDVPSTDRLIQSGWTACASGTDVHLDITTSSTVRPAPAVGEVVDVAGDIYLVAMGRPDPQTGVQQAYHYLVPKSGSRDRMLDQLGVPLVGEARKVPLSWLDLTPSGGALDSSSFDLAGAGGSTSIAGREYVVGSVVEDVDAYYLVTEDGFMKLDPFGYAVYTNVTRAKTSSGSVSGAVADPSYADPDGNDAHWPDATLDRPFGDACVRLLTTPGQPPRTEIVAEPEDASVGTANGPSVSVDDGSGAYVRSGSFDSGSQGRAYLVDARGNAYQLVGAIVPGNLGYGSVRPPVVPDSWVELLGNGVPLSQDLALCSPRQDRSSPCTGS
jgi:type VII secretion protein EccB